MTRNARRIVLSLVAAAVVLAACTVLLVKLWPRAPPGVPPDLVPASWAQYRSSPGHVAHVGHATVGCRDCHAIERDGFKNPGVSVCAACHAKESTLGHHGGQGRAATDCLTCHVFSPARSAPTCLSCHAAPEGALPAVVQHATVDCTKCHRLHESPPIVPADCTSCHDERAAKHAEHAGSKGCLDCHHAHQPAPTATAACASCHAQGTEPHPASHDACIGCHAPHDFAAGSDACLGCHRGKTTLAEHEVPAHRVCIDCHAPHAPGGAAAACVRCHEKVQVRHGSAGACITCHAPHGDDPTLVAATCTSCHTKVAVADTGAHTGAVACEGCHKPHAFGGLSEKALCRDCHARQTALVASNPGHADCGACHGPSVAHAPAPPVACGTCHAIEQKSAPVGHQRCVSCHEPHAGQPTPACASCHAQEATGPHGAIQGGCATCHRPHGPSGIAAPPGCKTCHSPAALPALHAAPGHAECASCHKLPHEAPRADRVTCTGHCHVDKRDHQPAAQLCDGCHVFRR